MSRHGAVAVRCPGKVNLHLEVLGRRPDGYHELRTLFAAVGVWDELELTPAPAGVHELSVEPAGAVSAGTDNLVLRAAGAAAAAWRPGAGARIRLHKRIPVAGGMGGGSSDTAAALVGLSRLWHVEVDDAGMHRLASELGSDVPFFLIGGAAWGEGRGTELHALADLPPWWLVLLPGREPISTAEVYGLLRGGTAGGARDPAVYDWCAGGGELPLASCRNDLGATVAAGWPWVAQSLRELEATNPLLAMVSGSGGTVFAVYPSETRARGEAARLACHGPLVAPLLSRASSRLTAAVVEEA